MEIVVKLTSNLSLFYLPNYFYPWEKHSILVSVPLRKQNDYESWDKDLLQELELIQLWEELGQCSSETEGAKDQRSHQQANPRRSQAHSCCEGGAEGEVYGRSLGSKPDVLWWAWSSYWPGETAVGKAGCGVEESEDKLEATGTSMSGVAVTHPHHLQRAMAADFRLLLKSQVTMFLTNFSPEPYSCSLTRLTHINFLAHHKVIFLLIFYNGKRMGF